MGDGQQTYLLLIGLFSMTTVVAVALSRHRIVRRTYVGFLLGLVVVAGVTGAAVWPFPSWHLFPTVQPRVTSYSEIRVADADDRERRLPAEALAPLEPTPVRRLVTDDFPSYTIEEQAEFAEFVLERSNRYRHAVIGHRRSPTVRFPARHTGHAWESDDLEAVGPFIAFRVYDIELTLSRDFSGVESMDETMSFEHKP